MKTRNEVVALVRAKIRLLHFAYGDKNQEPNVVRSPVRIDVLWLIL